MTDTPPNQQHQHPRPIVAKFGGSSVADADQVRKIAAIVRADPRRRFVVVSAPGKRNDKDKKITDLLYLCHSLGEQGLDSSAPFAVIKERYLGIASELGVAGAWEWLRDIGQQIASGAAKDWVASRGEYLSARIIADFLGAEFVDAADGIRFGDDGRFHEGESYDRLGARLAAVPEDRIAVIPGFYGQDAQGKIKCFSRGGSDVTGAIVARAVHAAIYENWTDVSGLLMADPRLVENPCPIEEITYREQRELSYMGATVLHDEAVFPVREAGIPIHIKNTNRPEDVGTQIVTRRDSRATTIVGIAGRKGFATLFTEKAMMNQERGYGRKVLEILESHGISYEHSPTSIDTLSVIVTDEELDGKEHEVVAEIRRVVQPDRIEVQRDMAMLAVVGQGMISRVGIAARVFAALADSKTNIRMINQGSSELNIIVGVATQDYEKAVRAIYAAFVGVRSRTGLDYSHKVPQETTDYKVHSDFVIGHISAIMADSIAGGNNKIFIHTNLRRGLPLENINKVAGPFVEAWAMEQFENISDVPENPYELIHAEPGKRLDPFDIILQFRRKGERAEYVSANVDVKATAEDILSSGKSPNITSYARIRSEYVNDPDYIFIVLSLKHRVFSEKQKDTGMTNGIMEVVSYSVYDLKFISEADLSYNPALGTGQLQIRDIHYVQLVTRTTWEFCQMLDAKFMRSRSRGEAGWLLMAKKYGWIKELK